MQVKHKLHRSRKRKQVLEVNSPVAPVKGAVEMITRRVVRKTTKKMPRRILKTRTKTQTKTRRTRTKRSLSLLMVMRKMKKKRKRVKLLCEVRVMSMSLT